MDISKFVKNIKDGVLNITDNIDSIKVRKNSSRSIRQSNIVAGGDVVAGNITHNGKGNSFVQNVSGKSAKGNQRIWINGKEVDAEIANEITTINVTGNVNTIDSQGVVEVGGDVTGGINTQGRVEVHGDVDGNIDTQGRVSCGDVTGDIDTQGRVECGNVGGDIDCMGGVIINK